MVEFGKAVLLGVALYYVWGYSHYTTDSVHHRYFTRSGLGTTGWQVMTNSRTGTTSVGPLPDSRAWAARQTPPFPHVYR